MNMFSNNSYTRPDGTRVTDTSIPDMVTPSTQPTNDDWLKAILDRTQSMRDQEGKPTYFKPKTKTIGGGNSRVGRAAPADPSHNQSPQERDLGAMAMMAKRAQLDAMLRPPPQRMTTFASGAINGYTPDVNNYSGAQRAAYLPNNAGATADGLSDGQIQSMSPVGAANSWEAQMAQNPNSSQNASGPSQFELMRVIQQLQAQLAGRR